MLVLMLYVSHPVPVQPGAERDNISSGGSGRTHPSMHGTEGGSCDKHATICSSTIPVYCTVSLEPGRGLEGKGSCYWTVGCMSHNFVYALQTCL